MSATFTLDWMPAAGPGNQAFSDATTGDPTLPSVPPDRSVQLVVKHRAMHGESRADMTGTPAWAIETLDTLLVNPGVYEITVTFKNLAAPPMPVDVPEVVAC